MDAVIEAKNLTKRFRRQPVDQPAVKELSLQVNPGQLFGLIGPDGAGKTTLIRMLSSVMEPTTGSARVLGFDVVHQAEQMRPFVGYMPQAFSLYPDLTVRENIDFFADLHGISGEKRADRIAELLEFARLTEFQDRRGGLLSGGMRKKLALACALIHEPKVLFLDEPTTGVDPVSRRELWELLSRVALQGVTVFMSTPYMDEAERCNAVAIIYQGSLLTQGTPVDLEAELPFDVLEVKARPRAKMRELVGKTGGIVDWRPVGDRLRLWVKDAKAVKKHLEETFERGGLEVDILRQARPTMEDVFIHLMNHRKEGA